MKVYKLESYSTKKSQLCTLTQLSAVLFSLHTKLVPIKLHMVTTSGISLVIITCFNIVVSFQFSLNNQNRICQFCFCCSILILQRLSGRILVSFLHWSVVFVSGVRRKFSWGFHSVVHGGHFYLVCAVCDVTTWRHIHVFKRSFLT